MSLFFVFLTCFVVNETNQYTNMKKQKSEKKTSMTIKQQIPNTQNNAKTNYDFKSCS